MALLTVHGLGCEVLYRKRTNLLVWPTCPSKSWSVDLEPRGRKRCSEVVSHCCDLKPTEGRHTDLPEGRSCKPQAGELDICPWADSLQLIHSLCGRGDRLGANVGVPGTSLSHREERLRTPKLSHSGQANQGRVRMTKQMTDHSHPRGGSLCPGVYLPGRSYRIQTWEGALIVVVGISTNIMILQTIGTDHI